VLPRVADANVLHGGFEAVPHRLAVHRELAQDLSGQARELEAQRGRTGI
jgi:hypothetical protein